MNVGELSKASPVGQLLRRVVMSVSNHVVDEEAVDALAIPFYVCAGGWLAEGFEVFESSLAALCFVSFNKAGIV